MEFNEQYLNGEFQIIFDELNTDITEDEIIKACKELRTGRSSGPDQVLNEFFKHGITYLVSYLERLFNTCFRFSYFPEVWADGYIVPLHKKGDINSTEKYREITLLSTLGK